MNVRAGSGFRVAGAAADGLGLAAFGLAALFHFGIFWRQIPRARSIAAGGMILGGLTMLVGFALFL